MYACFLLQNKNKIKERERAITFMFSSFQKTSTIYGIEAVRNFMLAHSKYLEIMHKFMKTSTIIFEIMKKKS